MKGPKGRNARLQLSQYSARKGRTGYFPLAVGNTWEYTWVGMPAGYEAREVYRVIAQEGRVWYVEYYSYAYRR